MSIYIEGISTTVRNKKVSCDCGREKHSKIAILCGKITLDICETKLIIETI